MIIGIINRWLFVPFRVVIVNGLICVPLTLLASPTLIGEGETRGRVETASGIGA